MSTSVARRPAPGPLEAPAGVHILVGTRPEAVKIAPLVQAMRAAGRVAVVVDTGQQPGRVAEALAPFGLAPDLCLNLARSNGSLNELVALTVTAVDQHVMLHRPAAVLVQGDTTTALAAALAAHLRRVPVVHLEAGLRTYDVDNPFPEETNRTLLADLAALHLAPTPRAAIALAAEGHRGPEVVVTGNTVVDALHTLLPRARGVEHPVLGELPSGAPLLVATVHRREAWGDGVRTVARAVRALLTEYPALHAAVVTHPNPAVAADVRGVLADAERCTLLDPQPYDAMLSLLSRADVVVTDSGGIQEEAPTIGVRVVVARMVTERPEGVDAGWAELVGHEDGDAIVAAARRVLDERAADPAGEDAGETARRGGNPYGDGRAATRAAQAIAWLLGNEPRPQDWVPDAGAAPLHADLRHGPSTGVRTWTKCR